MGRVHVLKCDGLYVCQHMCAPLLLGLLTKWTRKRSNLSIPHKPSWYLAIFLALAETINWWDAEMISHCLTFSYLWLVFHSLDVINKSSRFTSPSPIALRTPSPASFSLP